MIGRVICFDPLIRSKQNSALNNDGLYHSFSVNSVMKGYTVETFVHLFDS